MFWSIVTKKMINLVFHNQKIMEHRDSKNYLETILVRRCPKNNFVPCITKQLFDNKYYLEQCLVSCCPTKQHPNWIAIVNNYLEMILVGRCPKQMFWVMHNQTIIR